MSRKSHLTLKEEQKLKVLLEAIEDNNGGTKKDSEKQEQELLHVAESAGCIDEGEIQRFIDLGLGRGIDASNPTPWQNKTSILVRPVTFEGIVGTEESGSVQSYEREITRVSETHWRFSPSAVFNPNLAAAFSIGVEESFPRSQSSSKQFVVGTKVLNRTVCFKEIFHDSKNEEQVQPSSLMFEAWLCKWILKKYVKDDERPVDIDGRVDALRKEVLALNEEFETLQQEFTELTSKHEAIVGENAVENIKGELQELKHKKKVTKMEKEKLENKKKWFLNTLEKEYKKTGQTDEKQYKLDEFDQDYKFQEINLNKECDEIERRISLLSERCENEVNKLEEVEARFGEAKAARDEKEALLTEKTAKLKKTQSHQFAVDQLRKRLNRPELQREKIAKYCAQFLAQFRVTHYVSSIQLGASGYKVIAKSEVSRSLKVRNSIRVDKIAAGKATGDSTSSKAHSKKSSVGVSKIGVIEAEEDNKVVVKRKTHQEGVVGVQVKPVSDLITTLDLREPLKEGLLHYVRSEGDTSGYNYTEGPFLIRCEIDKKIFHWRVDDFHDVKAEDCEPAEATKFYIKPRSHREHLNEFNIVYYDSQNKKHADPFLPHYLQRSVSIFGRGAKQPLRFGLYSPERDTPLALFKEEVGAPTNGGRSLRIGTHRRNRSWSSVSLSSWINEQKSCIIQHTQHGSFTPSTFVVAVPLPDEKEADKRQVEITEEEAQQQSQARGEDLEAANELEQPTGGEPRTGPQEESQEVEDEEREQGTVEQQAAITEQESQPDQEIEESANEKEEESNPEYHVSWVDSNARIKVVKSFEIVSASSKVN